MVSSVTGLASSRFRISGQLRSSKTAPFWKHRNEVSGPIQKQASVLIAVFELAIALGCNPPMIEWGAGAVAYRSPALPSHVMAFCVRLKLGNRLHAFGVAVHTPVRSQPRTAMVLVRPQPPLLDSSTTSSLLSAAVVLSILPIPAILLLIFQTRSLSLIYNPAT